MDLKGRLALIASFVPGCTLVCDVGTDHAYIPVFLVKEGICNKALALDINKGPLLAANENIKQYGLQDKIETRLGNGLEPLKKEEADVIVIAGMGGILISEILEASFDKAKAANELILQPMNAIEILRQWLFENGFEILDEELTNEEAKIYNVMKVKWTGTVLPFEKIDCYIGSKLVEKGGSLVQNFVKRKIRQAEKVIGGIKKSKDPDEEFLKLQLYLKASYEKILNALEGRKNA